MDEADLADPVRAELIGDDIAQARRKLGDAAIVRRRCIDCDEPIPEQRIRAMEQNNMACERCVRCQAAFERDGG